MADYDMALDLEPNNFLGHYNRGLLRTDVGDDNRAILDFDFVLRLEPDNMLALFNRGVLLERTGDIKGAINDYTKVIEEYPNFHTGILYRARCYRRLGMTQKAFIFENIRGSLVGVYFPDYMDGINMPGWHLHFLSEDRSKGGHVFDVSVQEGIAKVDKITNIFINLPKEAAFDTYSLKQDLQAEIKSVE